MLNQNILQQLVIGLLLLGCNAKPEVEKAQVTSVAKDHVASVPPVSTGFKVSAFLIYEDGSISSFDVLNDKTKALWNTIIGAGDAEKPSNRIKVILTGQLDSLNVNIVHGKKKVVDENLTAKKEFIIEDTGCELVKVKVTKKRETVFEGTIDFHCGE